MQLCQAVDATPRALGTFAHLGIVNVYGIESIQFHFSAVSSLRVEPVNLRETDFLFAFEVDLSRGHYKKRISAWFFALSSTTRFLSKLPASNHL